VALLWCCCGVFVLLWCCWGVVVVLLSSNLAQPCVCLWVGSHSLNAHNGLVDSVLQIPKNVTPLETQNPCSGIPFVLISVLDPY